MSIRIMIVDDSRFVYEEMKWMLADTEFEVAAYCRDGESAVSAFQTTKPDLITMDILLPGMDGFEAAQRILQEDPTARIVFISSLAYDDTIQQAKELGTSEFVFKPFDRATLIQALTKTACSQNTSKTRE